MAEWTSFVGTERLSGLVILSLENEQAEKLNLEQSVEDFEVHKTHRKTFRQVSTTTFSLMDVTLSHANTLNCAALFLLQCVCLWLQRCTFYTSEICVVCHGDVLCYC